MSAEQPQPLIELAGQRMVSFMDRGQAFIYIFRKIEEADWKKFFSALVMESQTETHGQEVTRTNLFDFKSAGLDLVDLCLVGVHGYILPEGKPLESIPNWKQKLPYAHRVKAASLLQEVAVSQNRDNFAVFSDSEEVVLRAKWGSSSPGKMNEFDGLVHRFVSPDLEQQRIYNRAISETRIVQDGNGKVRTIHPMHQELLISLYDQNIRSVEGYQVGGAILGATEDIVRHMDAMHKVIAAQALFSGAVSEAAS